MQVTHTAENLIIGDYDEGKPTQLPLPAVDPIMIIRDPPGGGSYAYYNNVRTLSTMRFKGYEGYAGFHANLGPGAGVDVDTALCVGLGVSTTNLFYVDIAFKNSFLSSYRYCHWKAASCLRAAMADAIFGASTEHAKKFVTEYDDDTTEISFVTSWSYQTSAEPTNAGHDSDIFVVPNYYLLIHTVFEVSLDAESCAGMGKKKVKFDADIGQGEKAISFLSFSLIVALLSSNEIIILNRNG